LEVICRSAVESSIISP